MTSNLFIENDPRGKIIYNNLINNENIIKDYFVNEDIKYNLEILFDITNIPLSNESILVKLFLLNKLKNKKLTIYKYFDLVDCFFNKYYYNMVLNPKEEELINNIFLN
jgi:hypothetical protein